MNSLQRPVVCVVVVYEGRILLQRRNKRSDDTPYNNLWELPQGKVERGESLTEAAIRELREEAGLEVVEVLSSQLLPMEPRWPTTSDLHIYRPIVCVVDTIQNHIGIPLIVRAAGSLGTTKEADSHRWFSADEILAMIGARLVFPLNVPMLEGILSEGAEVWAS